jgi:hypothetical protein
MWKMLKTNADMRRVFMAQVIVPERKVLAVYPVFFFYAFLAWMVLIS